MGFLFPWILYGIVSVLTLFITISYFYMTRNFKYWKKRGVAEIPPVPFVGNFRRYFKYEKSPGALFKSFYDENEDLPYVGIYILDKPCLLIRDPELIKRILIKDFHSFSDKFSHSSKNDDMSNNSLFFINNPHWKYVREKFTSLFTTSKMKTMFFNVQEIGKDLNDYLDSLKLDGPGKQINIKLVADKFTSDLFGLNNFGLKLNNLKTSDGNFQKIVKAVFGNYNVKRSIEFSTIWIAPQFASIFGFRFFLKKTCKFFRKVFEEILDGETKSKVKRNDFIDLMMMLRDNQESPEFKFEEDTLISQMLTFAIAGFEASSSLLSYTLFELAKDLEIQTKLRNEINLAVAKSNGKIAYEMLMGMQFLDSILSETLRKYPTLPFIDRRATRDYKIEETGLIIEKGTPIIVPMLGLHYDEKYFPDPQVFDPERFSSEQKSSRNPYVYMPFGIGSRSCIGKRQGLLQVKIGLVYIVSKFEVSLSKKKSLEFNKLTVFLSIKDTLFLKMRKIDANDTERVEIIA